MKKKVKAVEAPEGVKWRTVESLVCGSVEVLLSDLRNRFAGDKTIVVYGKNAEFTIPEKHKRFIVINIYRNLPTRMFNGFANYYKKVDNR